MALAILCSLTFVQCKKKLSYTIHGNVKQYYSHANISGIYVWIANAKMTYSSAETYAQNTHTDANGNYSVSFDVKEDKNGEHQFTIGIAPPGDYNPMYSGLYDSTQNAYKFCDVMSKEIFASESGNSQDFLLYPSGSVKFYISNNTWAQINADSVMVESPYESKILVKDTIPENRIFAVDPSVESTFKWCYIKNGIQSTKIVKNIFIPNNWTNFYLHGWENLPGFSYRIEF
jgi:hypothetical protein